MTQIARTVAAAPAIANVASARVSGARALPSGVGPVEQLTQPNDLNFDSAFNFELGTEQDFEGQSGFEEGFRRQRRPDLGRGIVNAPSETFARIVEREIAIDGGTGRAEDGGDSRLFGGLVARAINTYETNAQVIQGTQPRTGLSLSISL